MIWLKNSTVLDIASTLLELGDSTSRNLEFSQRDDVHISYGEETITEFNLLEIMRHHQKFVHLLTFNKSEEGANGADWEWHIIGRRYTFKMRVQAKRIGIDDILKIKYKQQRELLIERATDDKIKAVYCIYSKDCQREFWNESRSLPGYKSFQAGCLLADADDVPDTVTKLGDIEKKCIPWHYLFSPQIWTYNEKFEDPSKFILFRQFHSPITVFPDLVREYQTSLGNSSWNPPTIKDLNEETGRNFDWTGVERTTTDSFETARSPEKFRGYFKEMGVRRILIMNVSGEY